MSSRSRIAVDYKPTQSSSRASIHARWFASGLLLPLIGGVIAYKIANQEAPAVAPTQDLAPIDLGPAAPLELTDTLPTPIAGPVGTTVDYVVRRNDTFDRIFRQLKLNLTDLASIRDLPGVQQSLDRVKPGDTITFVHQDGELQTLSRRISETEILSVTRGDQGFASEIVSTPIEVRDIYAQGTIESSLFVSARAAGVSPEIILQLANNIFGWDIDFALDIQPGDRFRIIYEKKFRSGEYVGDARILAADFINAGRTYRAVYFESADGQIKDYFAPDGRSMHRQFLRAPLDFTRISSNFNPKRRHPLLNTIRAHKGVDYAAPTGTVIKAAGDGRISFVGTKGGYGRVIILEHGGGVTTLYGHMSRFAASLRNGTRVKQGVTIGYVGSSGAATGPHLHYEYRVNGVHKNPRTVSLPDAAPISSAYLTEFQTQSGALLARLDRIGAPAVAASPD